MVVKSSAELVELIHRYIGDFDFQGATKRLKDCAMEKQHMKLARPFEMVIYVKINISHNKVFGAKINWNP
jgi:hypothetical protein